MSDRIDVSEHTNALCAALGLEPSLVREITIRPTDISAVIYLVDDHGSKFLEHGKIQTRALDLVAATSLEEQDAPTAEVYAKVRT